jgi:hypothetical protein
LRETLRINKIAAMIIVSLFFSPRSLFRHFGGRQSKMNGPIEIRRIGHFDPHLTAKPFRRILDTEAQPLSFPNGKLDWTKGSSTILQESVNLEQANAKQGLLLHRIIRQIRVALECRLTVRDGRPANHQVHRMISDFLFRKKLHEQTGHFWRKPVRPGDLLGRRCNGGQMRICKKIPLAFVFVVTQAKHQRECNNAANGKQEILTAIHGSSFA